jgi:uncharacterized protein
LVTYAWPENSARYVRMTKFVREFFGKIDLFQDGARHPKWREINIAADMPGWVRFRPATEWIAENRKVAALQDKGPQLANVKALFEQYLTESGATAGKSLSDNDRQELFGQFQEFLAARRR